MSFSFIKKDPELFELIEQENRRQLEGIDLIASENFASEGVLQCLGSCLTNKYSEGQPGNRFYGGNEFIDKIELLCKKRCLEAFGLEESTWSVNVQAYSGSVANLAVYAAFLEPDDLIMGLSVPSGGHLSHGHFTPSSKVTAASKYYRSIPYEVDAETGLINFHKLAENARIHKPKIIICGASAYSRTIDFGKFRSIADEIGCFLMADIAHIAGLVAANFHPSPFECCDIVTSTTHKTLRGPRSGLIFVNKKRCGEDSAARVDRAVFPFLQGGPHNNQIAAIAFQMKEVNSPEWVSYCSELIRNCKSLSMYLIDCGEVIVTGGTDNHLFLWDLRPHDITGLKFEKVSEVANIYLNRNSLPGDSSCKYPSGVRIGLAAMTTRRCSVEQINDIGNFLLKALHICKKRQNMYGKKLSSFLKGVENDFDVKKLASEVIQFTRALRSEMSIDDQQST